MPRGGRRRGTPGNSYSNRTDLATNYAPVEGTATPAAGGQAAPPPTPGPGNSDLSFQALSQGGSFPTPDDTPSLLDPTSNPGEPVTAGLDVGPGPGREALGLDSRRADIEMIRQRWLPMLEAYTQSPATPSSVRALVAFIKSA